MERPPFAKRPSSSMPQNRPETPSSPVRLLVTAGPTHEPIDAVRYIGNRSSGRMGVALAQSGLARGWHTTLLLGPTAPPNHDTGLAVVGFRTADELRGLLERHVPECDVLVMAAAVADYRPLSPTPDRKIRRQNTRLRLELEPVPDLLASLQAIKRPHQRFVGFALEPRAQLAERTSQKLQQKGLDAIVGNPLETMDSAKAEGVMLLRRGSEIERLTLPRQTKEALANRVIEAIATLVRETP